MKQFFKYMFASMLGTFLAVFALFFVFFIIIAGAVSSAFSDFDKSNRPTSVKENTILKIDLDRPIADRGPEQVFNLDFGPFQSVSPIGLDQIRENLKKAKEDENIEGILLSTSSPMAGMATLEEIRNALIDFKSSGKWIVSYGEVYSQSAYYLASVADEIYVYPEGGIDFRGLSTNIAFLKGMFDKLEVEMQVIRGSNNKFKSAVEPFMLDQMSQANRLQTEKWLNSLWGNMLNGIGASRGMDSTALATIADQYLVQNAEDAVMQKLAVATKYGDEVIEILKQKTETEEGEDLRTVSLSDYFRAPEKRDEDTFVPSYKKDKIAVIYANGQINSGKSGDDAIGSETFATAIRSARQDTSIKAIVLRINSPGGSALASDVIWRETVLAKEAKPLVVSMGDVAASGGYYIAAAADRIFVMPGTITGSIGVFGVLPNMKGLFNNKMGITFDGVKTGEFADYPEVTRPLTSDEYEILQRGVDETYARFTEIVAEGRHMTQEEVDNIGQGRVWSGADAITIGLADSIGGMEHAVKAAAELAGIEDYILRNLPEREDPFEEFIKEFAGEVSNAVLRHQLGGDEALLNQFKHVRAVKEMRGIQAVIPYRIEVK